MEYIIRTGFFGGNALNNVCKLLGINTNPSLSLIFIFWSSTVKPRKLSCGRWSCMSTEIKKNSMQSANGNVNKQVSEEFELQALVKLEDLGAFLKCTFCSFSTSSDC